MTKKKVPPDYQGKFNVAVLDMITDLCQVAQYLIDKQRCPDDLNKIAKQLEEVKRRTGNTPIPD